MSHGKVVGSVMLVMGTLIGGGVLALPMVGIGAGAVPVLLLIIFMWLLMLATGLLFLEVNLSLPSEDNSFTSMAQKTLGRSGQIVTFISYLLLLYALVAAYTAGGGSLLSQLFSLGGFHLSSKWCSLLFIGILGSFVFHGVKMVDHVNRWFFSFKALFLVGSLALLTSYVDVSSSLIHRWEFKYIWAGAPIFLCSFGYHVLIPTLSKYLGRDSQLICRVLFWGTFLTMLIYSYWLFELLGLISLDQFSMFLQAQGSTGEFVALIMNTVNNQWVSLAINSFANITITTSFLGVSLGLFDFLSDMINRSKQRLGKRSILFLTFAPPSLFVIFYPQGFIIALGYAAICVAFSHVVLPAMMVWQIRKKVHVPKYRLFGGRVLVAFVFLVGIVLMVMQMIATQLPHFLEEGQESDFSLNRINKAELSITEKHPAS
jgi:tyrosine-specific transport protein